VFPKVRNIKPHYDQKNFDPKNRENKLQLIVSPEKDSEGVWINQDAKFYLGNLKKGFQTGYSVSRKENGVYAFVIEGDVTINGQKLSKRDGFGIWEVDKFQITADSDSELLLMDVPMMEAEF
jgi:redox-sensitive bicupin YhaK (pirin superfamily)